VEPDDVSTHKTLFPPSGSAWAHLRQLQPRTKAWSPATLSICSTSVRGPPNMCGDWRRSPGARRTSIRA